MKTATRTKIKIHNFTCKCEGRKTLGKHNNRNHNQIHCCHRMSRINATHFHLSCIFRRHNDVVGKIVRCLNLNNANEILFFGCARSALVTK